MTELNEGMQLETPKPDQQSDAKRISPILSCVLPGESTGYQAYVETGSLRLHVREAINSERLLPPMD